MTNEPKKETHRAPYGAGQVGEGSEIFEMQITTKDVVRIKKVEFTALEIGVAIEMERGVGFLTVKLLELGEFSVAVAEEHHVLFVIRIEAQMAAVFRLFPLEKRLIAAVVLNVPILLVLPELTSRRELVELVKQIQIRCLPGLAGLADLGGLLVRTQTARASLALLGVHAFTRGLVGEVRFGALIARAVLASSGRRLAAPRPRDFKDHGGDEWVVLHRAEIVRSGVSESNDLSFGDAAALLVAER